MTRRSSRAMCARGWARRRIRSPGLDGKAYSNLSEMCVIGDDSGAIGLGGVMGGESTGCSIDTVDVFIESAYFDANRTARTGRATGIISDARFRNERGIDPHSCVDRDRAGDAADP